MQRWLVWTLVAVAVGATGLFLALVPPLPFVRDVWSAREQLVSDDLHVRGRMAEGLVASGRLIGMSRDEVVVLLGPPPPTDMFARFGLVYWLCPDRGFGIDSEWLVMNFDAQGKVSEARVIED